MAANVLCSTWRAQATQRPTDAVWSGCDGRWWRSWCRNGASFATPSGTLHPWSRSDRPVLVGSAMAFADRCGRADASQLARTGFRMMRSPSATALCFSPSRLRAPVHKEPACLKSTATTNTDPPRNPRHW